MGPSSPVSTYIGRTVDLLAFDDMDLLREVKLTQAIVKPGESGALIAGIQKLVQRFLIELLTVRGTLLYLPARGTDFMLEGRLGIWRTTNDLEQSFYSAIADLRDNLVLEESDDDPADEKFGAATLISASFIQGEVVIRVLLTSQAGISREILLPLRTTTANLGPTDGI